MTRRPRHARGAARRRGRRPRSRRSSSDGGRQRAEHHLVLGAHPQRGPARRHDDEVGAARDEVGQQRRRPGELLEVVEHQQDPQAGEVGDERVERVGADGLGQAERGDDPRHHERRLAHRREVDGAGATGELRRLAVQQLHREPGLADPAGPGDGHQPVGARADEGAQLVEVGLAADERGRRRRRSRGGGPERRCRGSGWRVAGIRLGGRGRRWRGGGRRRPGHLRNGRCRPDPWHGIPAGDRGDQSGTFVVVEGEAVGEGTDGVRVGAPALAALEGADRLGGQAGSLGQLLLGQRPRLAQAAQHDGEVARRRTWIHGSDASPSDAGCVSASSGRAGVVPVWACCGWGGAAPRREGGRDGIRPPRREERP